MSGDLWRDLFDPFSDLPRASKEREERERREAERAVPPRRPLLGMPQPKIVPRSDSEVLEDWELEKSPGERARDEEMREQASATGFRLPNNGRPSRRQKFDGRTMPWGKHQGVTLDKVPVQYVGWMFSEQIAGDMLLPDDLAAALLAAFLKQLRRLPVYARELDALSRIPRAVDDGRRAPTVTGDEEV